MRKDLKLKKITTLANGGGARKGLSVEGKNNEEESIGRQSAGESIRGYSRG